MEASSSLPFVQMLPHAPLEQPHEAPDRLVLATRAQFGQVNPAAAHLLRTLLGEGFRETAQIDVFGYLRIPG